MKPADTPTPLASPLPRPHAADAGRRRWLRQAAGMAAAAAVPLTHATAWASGSDAPEKTRVRVGYLPVTDCAPIVMASLLGFDRKYGVTLVPTQIASWNDVAARLASGRLDFAHALYGLVYGMQLGVEGPRQDMAVLMNLSQNGQGITLSNRLQQAGVVDGESLRKAIARGGRQYTFAQTFPTGTHAMWLYYWLASHGVDPLKEARPVTAPPARMVADTRRGAMDGFCVGEPWNARAIADGIGFSVATSQDIWADHPENVLGARQDFVNQNPNTARAVVAAIIEAGMWMEASRENMRRSAQVLTSRRYIEGGYNLVIGRMLGHYTNGLGKSWTDKHPLRFYGGGAATFPYLSDGMWFLTQHKRWGLLREHPDYLAVARRVNRLDVYRQAAAAAGAGLPPAEMRASRLMDGTLWTGLDPAGYADGFKIKAAA